MTTFTTEDRIIAEKDGSLTVNLSSNTSTITVINEHSLYSASSLDRLALCPPSARMSKDIPDNQSKDAERGTRIHSLGEMVLAGEDIDIVGVDADEVSLAKAYAEYVWDVAGEDGTVYIEESYRDSLSIYHPDLGGTADAVIINGDDIHVIDLKTGRTPVKAEGNKQMLTYALGALTKHGFNFKFVTLHIYQPGNVSKQVYTPNDINLWSAELLEIVKKADDPFEKPNPTAKGCFYCKAKTICPAIREKALEAAKQDFSNNTLEQLLDDAKLVSTWAEAIQEQAKQSILDGADAGHWYLKNGRKMVSYKDKVGVEAFFAGNEQAFEIKSPSALKKIGIEVPERYLDEKTSAPSLARKD
jgi:RecB family exonuclease